MIESLKTKLWELLEKKEVSLAMLYHKEGEILWHKGRNIVGKTVFEGDGFSKSFIHKSLEENAGIQRENVTVAASDFSLSQSAFLLNVKALIIQPLGDGFFLYLDSGTRRAFDDADREAFKVIGELLGMMILRIRKSQTGSGGVTGDSDVIEAIRELVLKYSLEESPILLLGETGVGKSHIAQLVHEYSGRGGEFVTVNTPGIPPELFESEIFGHKKGAFTGAGMDKRGLVDEAAGGTLFFDEISEVPVSFQARFLRFIETRKYQVLGDPKEREADVRIIAATNRELSEAMNKGEFREDLYYRLSVLEIRIPPLHERKNDLRALVKAHLHLLKGKALGDGFWDVITGHRWPGNVRELMTVLTRAGILLDGPVSGDDIREIIHYGSRKGGGEDSVHELVRGVLERIGAGSDFWEEVRKPFLNRDFNRREVKAVLANLLERYQGKYKSIMEPLNIEPEDHKKFLNFINDNKLK